MIAAAHKAAVQKPIKGGYGATAARVTPDHKVGSSNLSGLIKILLWLHNVYGEDAKVTGLS